MTDAPDELLPEAFRSTSAVDIFCGNTDAATWMARGSGENFIREALRKGQHVRILISDSVRKNFENKIDRKYPVKDIRDFQADWKFFLSHLQEWQGCEVRRSSFDGETTWIVIDRTTAYIASDHLSISRPLFAPLVGSAGPVLAGLFERIWHPEVSVLYQDLFPTLLEPVDSRLVEARSTYWSDLIDRLAADPHSLFGLPPREFEQLIFELLSRDGFECILTPATRDGGYDILARFRTPTSTILYLVECKRFGSQKPVGVSIVRALFGVVEQQSANVGLIVTTSHLSPDARSLKDDLRYRMEAREYEDLVGWLRKHRGHGC